MMTPGKLFVSHPKKFGFLLMWVGSNSPYGSKCSDSGCPILQILVKVFKI